MTNYKLYLSSKITIQSFGSLHIGNAENWYSPLHLSDCTHLELFRHWCPKNDFKSRKSQILSMTWVSLFMPLSFPLKSVQNVDPDSYFEAKFIKIEEVHLDRNKHFAFTKPSHHNFSHSKWKSKWNDRWLIYLVKQKLL